MPLPNIKNKREALRKKKLSLRRKLFAARIFLGVLLWGVAIFAERSWAGLMAVPSEIRGASAVAAPENPLWALALPDVSFSETNRKGTDSAIETFGGREHAFFETALDLRSLPSSAVYYPKIAREKGWQGTAILEIAVDSSGKAEKVRVIESSGYRILDQAARQAILQCRFIPAKPNNLPAASMVRVPFRFSLQADSEPEAGSRLGQ
ncbi:MAG TPA: energy transducer TonB [Candidatus Omnitrophota bacterium]|nr:energy transducer TonB [Candidatus Omnitrophota bacterium]